MQSANSPGRIRVCVFTSAHDPSDSRVVHREAVSLADAGYDVTYYTPFEGEAPVDTVSYADRSVGEVPAISARLSWAVDLARDLYDSDYDVYHFHDVELLPVGVLLGAVTDGTVIYDVHENIEDVLRHKPIFPGPVRAPLAKAASIVEGTLSRFVDGVVAASPDIAERFEGHPELTVVTNYPQRRWAEETDPSARREANEAAPVQFVYCGLLSEDRGIITVIDAIDRIPDEYNVSLVLGGKFASDADRERIERRIDRSERVEFVGWLPTLADVIDLFRESDVGVMCFQPDPNKTDAVHRSNKLFQYMAAGIPILVSDIGAWSRLVEGEGCGIGVDPEDPEAIADAMCELAADADRRAEFGRNGHQAALNRYNWESQRANLIALYERLTETKRVPNIDA